MWVPFRRPASKAGHTVIGVDSNAGKAELINAGRSPVVEKHLDAMIASALAEGRLRATTNHRAAIHESELAIVCVGTLSRGNGDLDLTYIKHVWEDIVEVV
jgi:GDP-mannose 6-dehydrogenase